VFLVLYVDEIRAGGDVGKNSTFNFAPTWLLLLTPFEAELVKMSGTFRKTSFKLLGSNFESRLIIRLSLNFNCFIWP
jgi:hypothetical protein